MTSRAKLELEVEISELQDNVMTCAAQLRKAEADLLNVNEKLEAARSKLKHHVNNRNYVRGFADLVSLEEYKSTAQYIRHLEVEIDSREFEKAVYQKTRNTLVAFITDSEAAISRKRALLGDFGRVISFPTK